MLAKVAEKKNQTVATLNLYELGNKNLGNKLAKEQLKSLVAFCEYTGVELGVQ